MSVMTALSVPVTSHSSQSALSDGATALWCPSTDVDAVSLCTA
jgi:hypothetical protein